jgi:putative ABC transport system permease protein
VSANRLVTINRTSIINTIPLSYRDEILRIPGVKYVTHDNWFGGVYQDPKNFFPAVCDRSGKPAAGFPGAHRSRRSVEYIPERSPRRDCRRGTMKRFGWKIGDRIPITTTIYGLAGKPFEFNIDGVYHGAKPEDDETQFWFQWEYFKESVPDAIKARSAGIRFASLTPTMPRASPRPSTTCT